MSDKIHLHFDSPATGSIGEISRDLEPILKESFILTCEYRDEIPVEREILLCHFLNRAIVKNQIFNSFKYKILIQPVDGSIFVKEAIESFNKFDLIICPALASKNILINNGVNVKIEVIPNYYKKDIFTKEIYTPIDKYIPENKIILYHESTFHPRKGIELLYEAFIKAFSNTKDYNNVVLICKDGSFNFKTFDRIESLKRDAINLQKKFVNPSTILKISNELSYKDLKQLWHRANIYVSFSKIEGFGIPLLRHYVMGKSVVIIDNKNSGHHDFLNQESIYSVPAKQVNAKDEFMWLYSKETEWAVPKIDDCISILRKAVSNYKQGINRTIESDLNKEKKIDFYSYENIGKLYVELIKNNFNSKISFNGKI